MLKFFRQYNKHILVVGGCLLMISFLLEPVLNSCTNAQVSETIGRLDGRKITTDDYRRASTEMGLLGALSPAMGQSYEPLQWILILHDAGKMGLSASRREADEILQISGASSVTINEVMRQYGVTLADILEAVQNWSVVQQYQSLAMGLDHMSPVARFKQMMERPFAFPTVPVSEPMVRRFIYDRRAEVSITGVEIPFGQYQPDIQPITEAQVKDLYEKHKNDLPGASKPYGFGYKLPDRVKLEYLSFPYDRAREVITVEEVDIYAHYERNKDLYLIPATPAPLPDPFPPIPAPPGTPTPGIPGTPAPGTPEIPPAPGTPGTPPITPPASPFEKVEPKTKDDEKPAPKTEEKAEEKTEPKLEEKTEPKAEEKTEPKAEEKPAPTEDAPAPAPACGDEDGKDAKDGKDTTDAKDAKEEKPAPVADPAVPAAPADPAAPVAPVPPAVPPAAPVIPPAPTSIAPLRDVDPIPVPSGPRYRPYEEVRESILRDLKDRRARDLVRKMVQSAQEMMLRDARRQPQVDGYFQFGGNVTPIPLSEVAAEIQKRFKVLPTVVKLDSEWLDIEAVRKLPELGSAIIPASQDRGGIPVAEYVFSTKELLEKESKNRLIPLRLQMNVPSQPVTDLTGLFLFRVTAAEPAQSASFEARKDDVDRDVRKLAAYRILESKAGDWVTRAQAEAIEEIARLQNTTVITSTFRRREMDFMGMSGLVVPNVPPIGQNEAFVDHVFDTASKAVKDGSLEGVPVAQRIGAVPIPGRLSLVVYRIDLFKPVPKTELDAAVADESAGEFFARTIITFGNDDESPLSVKALTKRVGFVPEETGKTEEKDKAKDQ